MAAADHRTVVIIPTYNESMTLPGALERLHAAVPFADVLVVDDGSPDGTGAIAERIATTESHVHVMHRAGKLGLGTAYVAGFEWALDAGYEVIVEMDADGSHRAEDLPHILDALDSYPDAALVLGSRWVAGGATENWSPVRQLISRGGSTYVRLALGVQVGDATGGFRAYRAATLRAIDLKSVASQGYCFQIDMLWRVLQMGGRVVEVPITFVERTAGESKMSGNIVAEALVNVTKWGVAHRAKQLKALADQAAQTVKEKVAESRR